MVAYFPHMITPPHIGVVIPLLVAVDHVSFARNHAGGVPFEVRALDGIGEQVWCGVVSVYLQQHYTTPTAYVSSKAALPSLSRVTKSRTPCGV